MHHRAKAGQCTAPPPRLPQHTPVSGAAPYPMRTAPAPTSSYTGARGTLWNRRRRRRLRRWESVKVVCPGSLPGGVGSGAEGTHSGSATMRSSSTCLIASCSSGACLIQCTVMRLRTSTPASWRTAASGAALRNCSSAGTTRASLDSTYAPHTARRRISRRRPTEPTRCYRMGWRGERVWRAAACRARDAPRASYLQALLGRLPCGVVGNQQRRQQRAHLRVQRGTAVV
jgi:hypothetical protein